MYHWYGQAIFANVVTRDDFLSRLHDFLDATLNVLEHPHQSYPAGLAEQNNVQGTTVTGPAFTWSIKLPDEYVNDPPEGNGYCGTFSNDVTAAGGECNDAVGELV